MRYFEKLKYDNRKNKFGVIAKIKFDDPADQDRRTMVQTNYKELMISGEWLDQYSSDPKNKKWEWGTPSDYLGKGIKLLLFDKRGDGGITIIAEIVPREAFYDDENHHTVRNVFKHKPTVLETPIPVTLVTEAGLRDPMNLGKIPFEDITESQFNDLMRKYDEWSKKVLK